QLLQPLTFFWQKAALAGAQPAFGVRLADPYVAILRRYVYIAHHYYPLARGVMLLQMSLQVCVEAGLGRKLERVVAAFPLRKVTIEDNQRRAVRTGQGSADHPALGVVLISGKALAHPQ